MRIAIAALLLAGCAAMPAPAPLPKAPQIVCLPCLVQDVSQWLKPCPIEAPKRYTIEEATRVANARRESLLRCNADKAEIAKALKQ